MSFNTLLRRLDQIKSSLDPEEKKTITEFTYYLCYVSKYEMHLIGGYGMSSLIRAIEILFDNLEIRHWPRILKSISGTQLEYYMSEEMFDRICGYAENSDKYDISDKLFIKLNERYGICFISNYNKDVVSSYDRFQILVEHTDCCNISILERVILSHQDYFVRSIQYTPTLWFSSSDIIRFIKNKLVREIIYDNLPYRYLVVLDSVEKMKNLTRYKCLRFVNNMVHYNVIEIDSRFDGNMKGYSYLFNNSYDLMRVYKYIAGEENKGKSGKALVYFIRNKRIIKQAKNYLPAYANNIVERMWKLNFRRMFTYNKNLDTFASKI